MSLPPAPAPILPELDGLRGLLALWVFAGHLLMVAGLQDAPHFELLANGQIPVTVFMMLSGFVIANSLARSSRPYGEYLKRRVLRLYPAYALSLLIAAAVGVFTADPDGLATPATAAAWRAMHESEAHYALAHWLAHATLLHGALPQAWLPYGSQTLNGPAWSLSLEWQFYLVAPLIFAALRRGANPAWRLALFAACAAGALPAIRAAAPLVPSLLPQSLGFFVIGMLTSRALARLALRPRSTTAGLAGVVGVTALMAGVGAALAAGLWLAVAALAHAKGASGPLRRALATPVLVRFGERSYAFYLFHMPVLLLLAAAVTRLDPAIARGGAAAVLMVALVVTDGLSRLSWRLVEQPALDLAGRRPRRDLQPSLSPVA